MSFTIFEGGVIIIFFIKNDIGILIMSTLKPLIAFASIAIFTTLILIC